MKQAGYNHRCVKGSLESRQRARITKRDLEDAQAETQMNAFIDSQERAAKTYWDSVIEW
ncbi:MAG: hypothetical protein Q8M94_20935 [Ignavibacteria bacterium]|nr:hypothetical protein [Ignavibacteria bacterium]